MATGVSDVRIGLGKQGIAVAAGGARPSVAQMAQMTPAQLQMTAVAQLQVTQPSSYEIVIQKRPGDQRVSLQLTDLGNGLATTGVIGASAAQVRCMSELGDLMGALLDGSLTNASISMGADGLPHIQMTRTGKGPTLQPQATAVIVKSISNIKS